MTNPMTFDPRVPADAPSTAVEVPTPAITLEHKVNFLMGFLANFAANDFHRAWDEFTAAL